MSELAVIVTAHDREDLVEDTLASLAEQEWDGDWEIVLVDNDSTDATPEILDRWADKMPVPTRVLNAADGHSCAYARNAGAAAVTATSIAFVDDDDLLASGWVAAIGSALRTNEYVGSRCDYDELNEPDVARLHHFQTERLGLHLGVPVVDGAGSGVRRALWNEVGGNDESLGFSEDAELGLRLARVGVTPHFCADAVVHVRLRTRLGTAWSRGTRRGVAEVQIFDRHGDALGAPADSVVVAVARWGRLLLQMRWLTTETGRAHWVEQVGRRAGRLCESIRLRRWYP